MKYEKPVLEEIELMLEGSFLLRPTGPEAGLKSDTNPESDSEENKGNISGDPNFWD